MSTEQTTYLRPPRFNNRPIGGDHAVGASSTVYIGPLGPGTYEIVAVGGRCHWSTGWWDAVTPDVHDDEEDPVVVTADDAPLLDGIAQTFVIANNSRDSGVAIIGASGVSATVWVRRT